MATQESIWISPNLCECVLQQTHTFSIKPETEERLRKMHPAIADHFMTALRERGQYDDVSRSFTVVAQCPAHAGLTPEDLIAELLHFSSSRHSPDTCQCSLSSWRDDREGIEHAHEHPLDTRRCVVHESLTDYQEHFDAVKAENVHKNLLVNAVAAALNLPPTVLVPWAYTADRAFSIDQKKLASFGVVIDPNVLQAATDVALAAAKEHPAGSKAPMRVDMTHSATTVIDG